MKTIDLVSVMNKLRLSLAKVLPNTWPIYLDSILDKVHYINPANFTQYENNSN